MKKKIFNKFDKHAINELPRVLFPGRIVTILTPGETEKAVNYLLDSDILGFDTETRPVFRRGKQNKVSLLQVCNREICFLFRLNRTGLTPAIIRLLEDTRVTKIGLSWHDDLLGLHKLGDFEAGTFVELQNLKKKKSKKDKSLQKTTQYPFDRCDGLQHVRHAGRRRPCGDFRQHPRGPVFFHG